MKIKILQQYIGCILLTHALCIKPRVTKKQHGVNRKEYVQYRCAWKHRFSAWKKVKKAMYIPCEHGDLNYQILRDGGQIG